MEAKFVYQQWQNGAKATCYVESALINEDNREVKIQLQDQNPETVEGIRFLESTVSVFPLNLTKTFPNLTFLSINNCGLKEISRSDLIGLERLVNIDLPQNELTSLPSDLLVNMRNLKRISFIGNKIERLNSIMFDGIKHQLELLDLRGNTSIDDWCGKSVYFTSPTSMDELMRIIDTKCKKPETKEAENFPQKFLKGFEELWLTRRFSDFTIVVGKEEFKVHKVVLAPLSKVLSDIFESDAADRLSIEDFAVEVVEDFLRFFYTGKIENEMNAMELFSLAGYFQVIELKTITESIISNQVDEKNAIEVLSLANDYGSEVLMKKSFAFVKRANPEIDFNESLMRKPDAVNELIKAKEEYERVVEKARKKFEQVREEYERVIENARRKLEEETMKISK